MIDAGLAADRRIHHGQQGGGHLHHGNASQPGGCRKSRHVAHHATAKGNDQRAPLQPAAKGCVMDQAHGGWGFLIFSRLDHQGAGVKPRLAEALQGSCAVVGFHHGVGHQQHLGACFKAKAPNLVAQSQQGCRADDHRVGGSLQLHPDRLQIHRAIIL